MILVNKAPPRGGSITHLNPVIFKLKCNNVIFNEIIILNASYVCLLHSRFVENHPI
jgi:hypothetical protein